MRMRIGAVMLAGLVACTGGGTDECKYDNDCSEGQVCQRGECVARVGGGNNASSGGSGASSGSGSSSGGNGSGNGSGSGTSSGGNSTSASNNSTSASTGSGSSGGSNSSGGVSCDGWAAPGDSETGCTCGAGSCAPNGCTDGQWCFNLLGICGGPPDCAGTSSSSSSSSSSGGSSGGLCTNTCQWHNDGECDDGGEGAQTESCEFGTDCADCGPRPGGSTSSSSSSSSSSGGGTCVGGEEGGQMAVSGTLGTDVSNISYAGGEVYATINHKIDVDAQEDGCISRVSFNISLTNPPGCSLYISYEAQYGLTQVYLQADSRCPGFLDAEEGSYYVDVEAAGGSNLWYLGPQDVGQEYQEQACMPNVTFTFPDGQLPAYGPDGVDTHYLDLGGLSISGSIYSYGSTDYACRVP
ncbi:MAG: hypothetical protein AB2A00_17645 [Myxococcota bacterium]